MIKAHSDVCGANVSRKNAKICFIGHESIFNTYSFEVLKSLLINYRLSSSQPLAKLWLSSSFLLFSFELL
jgi:hypothetical protein